MAKVFSPSSISTPLLFSGAAAYGATAISSDAAPAKQTSAVLETPVGSQERLDAAAKLLAFFSLSSALPPSVRPSTDGLGITPTTLHPSRAQGALLSTTVAFLCMIVAKYAPGWLLARLGIVRVLDRVVVQRNSGPFRTALEHSSGGTFPFRQTGFLWVFRHYVDAFIGGGGLLYVILVQPIFVALRLRGVVLPDHFVSNALFLLESMRAFSNSPTQAGPMLWMVGFWLLLISWVTILLYQLSSQQRSRALGVDKRDFPSVAHVLFQPHEPFFMISYTWKSVTGCRLARSLANALPCTWIDVNNLPAGGRSIAGATTHVASTAFALVFVLDAEYLTSYSCALELRAAILHRQAEQQHTFVLCLEPLLGSQQEMLTVLHGMGIRVFSSGQDLLAELAQHVYSCTAAADSQRLLKHMRRHASANPNWDSALLLPAPAVLRRQRIFPTSVTHLAPPPGSVFAGHAFISPDASCIGVLPWGPTLEHVLVFIFMIGVALFLAGASLCWTSGFDFMPSVFASLMCVICLALMHIFLLFTIASRSMHSPLLLGLNAASFCSDTVSLQVIFVGLGERDAGASKAQPGSDLAQRCERIRQFIEQHVGLRTLTLRNCQELATIYAATNSPVLYVALLLDAASASQFMQQPLNMRSRAVVLTYASLLGTSTSGSTEKGETLGDSPCILLGSKMGVEDAVPYDGIAPAVLDRLGSLAGAALLRGACDPTCD